MVLPVEVRCYMSCFRCLARHARCTPCRTSPPMPFFVHLSRETLDITPCRTSPPRSVRQDRARQDEDGPGTGRGGGRGQGQGMIPVSVNKHTPYGRALALQNSSRNCSPAPGFGDLHASIPTGLFDRRGVSFADAGITFSGVHL